MQAQACVVCSHDLSNLTVGWMRSTSTVQTEGWEHNGKERKYAELLQSDYAADELATGLQRRSIPPTFLGLRIPPRPPPEIARPWLEEPSA